MFRDLPRIRLVKQLDGGGKGHGDVVRTVPPRHEIVRTPIRGDVSEDWKVGGEDRGSTRLAHVRMDMGA